MGGVKRPMRPVTQWTVFQASSAVLPRAPAPQRPRVGSAGSDTSLESEAAAAAAAAATDERDSHSHSHSHSHSDSDSSKDLLAE